MRLDPAHLERLRLEEFAADLAGCPVKAAYFEDRTTGSLHVRLRADFQGRDISVEAQVDLLAHAKNPAAIDPVTLTVAELVKELRQAIVDSIELVPMEGMGS